MRKGDGEADLVLPSTSEALQIISQEGLGDFLRMVPVDLLIWRRFRGSWDNGLIDRVKEGCIAAWGDAGSIADVVDAATNGLASGVPSTTVALAISLTTMPDLRGNPRARFERDLLLVSHTAHSFSRRLLEAIVVPVVAEGWSIVLDNEGFALRSPMQHRAAIEAAVSDTSRLGLKAAACLLLAAAPAVRAPLSESWDRLLRQVSESKAKD